MRVSEIVALTLYLECRGEPALGQIAVGCVIRNRSRDKKHRWPRSLDEVCLQEKQFSCWNFTTPAKQQTIVDWDDPVWDQLFRLALAFTQDLIPDITNGANHYLNPKVVIAEAGKLPSWADSERVTMDVGNHRFYRL